TACGAAIQAAILRGVHCDATVWDVTPLALVGRLSGGATVTLVRPNASTPVRATAVLSGGRPPRLVQSAPGLPPPGEGGPLTLGRLPAGPARLAFDVDDDGLVRVAAIDEATGAERRIDVRIDTRMRPDELALAAAVVGRDRAGANTPER